MDIGRALGQLSALASNPNTRRSEFKDLADQIQAAIKTRPGQERTALFGELQAAWSQYKTTQSDRYSQLEHQVEDLVTQMSAVAAHGFWRGNREELLGHLGSRKELSNLCSQLGRLPRPLADRLHGSRREMNERVFSLRDQVQADGALAVEAAWARAVNLHAQDQHREAWIAFKEAQAEVRRSFLSKEDFDDYRQRLDRLYNDIQAARQARTEAWRTRTYEKIERLQAAAERKRAFADRQLSAADACDERAADARTYEFSDRMQTFAAEHREKASEALDAVRDIEQQIISLESRLNGA